MTRASIGRLTSIGTINAAAMEIIAGAGKGFWLRRLDLTLAAATASIYAIGRPAVIGLTPTGPVLFPPETSSDPSTIVAATALAWATPPTAPATFYRQVTMPATIGAQAVFTFDQLYVKAGSSIVLWNLAANSVAYTNVVIDEA